MEKQKSKQKMSSGRWTRAQHNKFMDALEKYGRNWEMVQKKVRTRTLLQVRTHAQKVFLNMSDHDIDAIIGYEGEVSEEKFRLKSKKNSKDLQESKTIINYSQNNENAKTDQSLQKEQDIQQKLDLTNQTPKIISNIIVQNLHKNAVSTIEVGNDSKQRSERQENKVNSPTPLITLNHPIYLIGNGMTNFSWNPLIFYPYQNYQENFLTLI